MRPRTALLALSLLAPALLATALSSPAEAMQAAAPDAATRIAMEKRTAARALLSSAIARIAANGSDGAALLDAGRASIDLEDYRAAIGFLTRAEQANPRDGAIKAALGSAMVHMENPSRALDYFGEAQLLGAPERQFLADRGLARDLLGQQDAAQRDYQLALSVAPSDEVTRRYAISLGISRETDRAIQLLTPQLRAQDRAAWRSRAMILAIGGRDAEATEIVNATMPAMLAQSILPYLAQMDRLTPAQQAAAAHFGRFPSGQLGPPRKPVQVAAAPATPTPAPAPAKRRGDRGKLVQVAAATPAPAGGGVVKAAVPPLVPPPPPVVQTPPPPAAMPRPAPSSPAPSSGILPADAGKSRNPAPAPTPIVPSRAAPLASLAQIAGSIEVPAEELAVAPSALGADALSRLRDEKKRTDAAETAKREKEAAAAKIKAEAEAKAKAEAALKKANPSRLWVQIAAGANQKALAFDFDRFAKKNAALFKGKGGGSTDWGRTRRLLVGPFKDKKAAADWLADYKKAGGDGFVFTSDAGQVVEPFK